MAITYYAGNRLTGGSGDTKPTSNVLTGTTFLETHTDDLYLWDGDSWELIASGNALRVKKLSALGTQASDWGVIYVDTSDEKLYYKFESDDAIDLTAGSAGGEANENSFKTIARTGTGSGNSIVAQNATDTITLVGGTNMTLTYGGSTADPTITFAAGASSTTITITDNEATNENNLLTFVENAATATGAHGLEMDGDLYYNPSTGLLTATGLSGSLALTGNATSTTIDAIWLVRDNRAAAFSFDAAGKTGILKIVSSDSGEKVTMSGGLDVTGTTTLGTSTLTSSSGATFKPHGTSAGNTSPISFAELAANGSHYVGFKAPDAITANITWVLPAIDATSSGQVLSSNASGVLSWVTDDNGASALDDLSDVTITSITSSTDAAAHILIYDDGDDQFENKTIIGQDSATGTSSVALDSDGKLGISSLTALTALDMVVGDRTIFSTIGNNTLTLGASNTTVNIAGDLIVTGDTTTVNTATLSVEDPLIILANGNEANSVDLGFYAKYRTNGTDLYTGLFWDATDSKYRLFHGNQAAPTTTVNTSGTGYGIATLIATLEGSASTVIVADSGNADTETFVAIFKAAGTGAAQAIFTDSAIKYNSNTNELNIGGLLTVDNLKLDGNTVSSTDSNGHVIVAPNGTGDVQLDADTIRVGDANAAATITSNGTGNLTLSTNAGTNSGTIVMAAGANNDISITPNGTGTVVLTKTTATQLDILARGDLRFQDAAGGEYVAVEAGATSATYTITLPVAAPTAVGHVLKTSGSSPYNILTWAAETGAANQNAWTTITRSASGGTAAGDASVIAVSVTDSVDLVAGANITITGDNSAKSITIAAAAASGASESFAIAMAVAL